MKPQRRFTRADLEDMQARRPAARLLEPMGALVRRIKQESQQARQMAAACNRNVPRRVRAELT